jgi:hypothetical protein
VQNHFPNSISYLIPFSGGFSLNKFKPTRYRLFLAHSNCDKDMDIDMASSSLDAEIAEKRLFLKEEAFGCDLELALE